LILGREVPENWSRGGRGEGGTRRALHSRIIRTVRNMKIEAQSRKTSMERKWDLVSEAGSLTDESSTTSTVIYCGKYIERYADWQARSNSAPLDRKRIVLAWGEDLKTKNYF
jgi:hypothetical protein